MFWTKKYTENVKVADVDFILLMLSLFTVFTFTTVAYFNFVRYPKQNHQVLHTQKSQKYPIYNKTKNWRIWNQTDLDVSV